MLSNIVAAPAVRSSGSFAETFGTFGTLFNQPVDNNVYMAGFCYFLNYFGVENIFTNNFCSPLVTVLSSTLWFIAKKSQTCVRIYIWF